MSAIETRRVALDKSVAEFALTISGPNAKESIFPTIADLIAFAAAYAVSLGDPLSVSDRASRPDPIRAATFASYQHLIDLLSAYHLNDVKTLRSSVESVNQRLEIFEGYANAGLHSLKEKLGAAPDKLVGLELLLKNIKGQSDEEAVDIDITGLADLDS